MNNIKERKLNDVQIIVCKGEIIVEQEIINIKYNNNKKRIEWPIHIKIAGVDYDINYDDIDNR